MRPRIKIKTKKKGWECSSVVERALPSMVEAESPSQHGGGQGRVPPLVLRERIEKRFSIFDVCALGTLPHICGCLECGNQTPMGSHN